MQWAGFNCSIPHKVAVIEHLDELASSAAIIGAVNCVVRRDGRLIGENTDGQGFVTSLRTVVDPAGKRVVVLGAGGAARAIAVETALAGASSITVVNVDRRRGGELAHLLDVRTPAAAAYVPWDGPVRLPDGTDIVVNATPVGLYPDVDARVDLDVDSLRPEMVVADVIPNPPSTHLLRDAAARGCRTIDGLGMLVNQGVLGIKLWTGIDVDSAVMYETLRRVPRRLRNAQPAKAGSGTAAPVMIATASWALCVWGVTTATRRPRRWMWMRSATSKTCGMLWLISTIGTPRLRTSRMRSRTRSDSLTPSAAVGSSMMITFDAKAAARATATP